MSARSEKNKTPKLKDLCSITSSKRIYAADYVEDGIPFVRGKEVVQRFSGSTPLESELFISPTKFETLRNRFGAPTAGDLLLTSVGTLGVPYLVTDGDEFYFKDGNLIWFRNFDGLNSKFFYYWIQSRAGRIQLAKCTIGTSQAAYTIERLKEIEAPKHSNDQQERIASILSAYDDLIENNRRRIALLEEAARLLYREWFVHFRFPGHEHVKLTDGLPVGWERRKFGQIAELKYGKALKQEDRTGGPFPVYGSSGIVGTHQTSLVEGPTIVVGRKGNVGSLFWSPVDFWPIDTVYFIPKEQVEFWLYFVLASAGFQNTDAGVPGLNREFAYSRELTYPSANLRRLFNETVEPMFAQRTTLENYNEKLAQARDLLLPRLMNGEIRV